MVVPNLTSRSVGYGRSKRGILDDPVRLLLVRDRSIRQKAKPQHSLSKMYPHIIMH